MPVTPPMSRPLSYGLHGRRALVAAASGGLGAALTAALLGEAVQVAGSARTQAGLAQVARLGAVALAADLGQPNAPATLVDDAVKALGGLDIVICCATAGAQAGTEEDWAASLALDLTAPRRLAEAARPHLAQSPAARVIHISSRSAHCPSPATPAYAAAKAALEQLTRAQAAAWAGEGIRVNCLAPGAFLTGRGYWDRAAPEARQALAATLPFGRLATADDIVPALLFLASDGGGWITGQTLLVDGGQTLTA